jgi:hypothetical protein
LGRLLLGRRLVAADDDGEYERRAQEALVLFAERKSSAAPSGRVLPFSLANAQTRAWWRFM